jgi:dCMP deaminase
MSQRDFSVESNEKSLEVKSLLDTKWDRRFLELAELVASWSKDPRTKCGAVIVRPDRTITSTGFNGFPKKCNDSLELYANQELKYARVIHAEQNAILHAKESLSGYSIYVSSPTCDRCSAHIIQAGISRVVYYKTDSDFAQRWKESFERGLDMYKEAGLDIIVLNFLEK